MKQKAVHPEPVEARQPEPPVRGRFDKLRTNGARAAAFILAPLLVAPALADDLNGGASTSGELRYTGSVLTGDDGGLEHDRWSVYGERDQPLFSADGGALVASAKGALLGFVDHVAPTRELAIRELYVDLLDGGFSLRAGWQDVPWSETFGFFIADIVNPRDLRDPLYLDPRYARLPVLALKPQWVSGNFTLQGVVTPVARNTLYSQAAFAGIPVVAPAPIEPRDWPRDLEAGLRADTLFFDKLDCALFYFRHLNRNLALDEIIAGGRPALQPVTRKVDSIGLTSSLALESIVFREDLVYTLHQPASSVDFGPPRNIDELQSILGMDYSTTDDFTFGLQYQFETHPAPFHWLSFKLSKKFRETGLQPELFVFRGVGNGDVWVEPQLIWSRNRLNLSLRYDSVGAATQTDGNFDGYLTPLRKSDRVLAEVSWEL